VQATSNNSPAFRLEGLTKTFYPMIPWHRHRAVQAVKDVTLAVPRGSIFSLLGPNGAGKTTTIKMIAGLVDPTSGRIAFHGEDGRELRRRPPLGAVLEGSRNLYWRLSPLENLYYFGELKGLPLAQIKREAEELLGMFDLADKARGSTQTLSRGMQQKVAVAVALLGSPDILLLDEPTLGLDVESSRLIQRRLRQMVEQQGKTIVLTTHQMELAARVADRIGIIHQGRLIAEDSLANLTAFFRRQDYELLLPAAEWEKLAPEAAQFLFDAEAAGTNGEMRVTFHFDSPEGFYALVEKMRRLQTAFTSFKQVTPSLEEIFLEITRHYPAKGGGAE
jgi:ABC-2 type transport system ATP-binding protein